LDWGVFISYSFAPYFTGPFLFFEVWRLEMNNGTSKAFIRLAVTAILMLNAWLTAKGMNPIPFDEAMVTEVLTCIAAGLSGVWVWWKNNNVSKEAQAAQMLKDDMKVDGIPDLYAYETVEIIEDDEE